MRKLSLEEALEVAGQRSFGELYAMNYAVVALNEEPDEVIDLRPWFITVLAVEKVSRLGHEPSYIPAIKAMCAVGRDENGYGLGLAAAKVVVDNIAAGKPYVFQLPYSAGAVAARSILEEGGMTVTLSREP